jgi:hypothetical protein
MSLLIFFAYQPVGGGGGGAPTLFLPTVRNGASAIYPLSRATTFATGLAAFKGGNEQRFINRGPLGKFTLQYTDIQQGDRDTLDTFLDQVQGSASQIWAFRLGTATYGGVQAIYPSCQFDANSFQWRETSQGLFAGQIQFSQTSTGGQIAAVSYSTFPTFANGLVQQFTIGRGKRGLNYISRMRCGRSFALPLFNAALPGFPARMLKQWEWPMSLSDVDLATLEQHFVACWGSFQAFSFTDPYDGTVYPNVRYSSDALQITHRGPDESTTTVRLVEYAA